MRLFLLKQERPPLLEYAGSLPPSASRQEYLVTVFSRRLDFEHRNKTLVYVPIGRQEMEEGPVLLGRIGRRIEAIENEPPEAGFKETTHASWRAANVLIDTRDHTDGQKVAFQARGDIGKPLAICSSLVEHINQTNQDSGWLIEVNVITEQATFWEAVRRNKGNITTAEFSFVTPNILGIRSRLNDDLKAARARHNATVARESLENPDGNLELSGDDIEEAIEYISKGGGKAKLKSGNQILYNSEVEEKSVTIDEDQPLSTQDSSAWKRIIDMLFK